MRNSPLPPVEELRRILLYDKETGDLFFRISTGSRAAGQRTGCVDVHGYVLVRIHRRCYRAHRIIWAMHHGDDPGSMMVDHINGIRSDNRICNLRLATPAQNVMNSRRQERNKTGQKGVFWDKERERYIVTVAQKHVAHTTSFEEAVHIYRSKAKEAFGDFARLD